MIAILSGRWCRLFMRHALDSVGSTWDGGASDYAHCKHRVSMATSPNHSPNADNADDHIEITYGIDQTFSGSGGADLEITCFNPSGTEYTKFKWEGTMPTADAVKHHLMGAGMMLLRYPRFLRRRSPRERTGQGDLRRRRLETSSGIRPGRVTRMEWMKPESIGKRR